MFLLWLRHLPKCGDRTPASVPSPAEGRYSPINTPVFPSSSFILPSFAWIYIFLSGGEGLLPAISWFSARSPVSEGVFLMHPWRKMFPMSIYFSTILSLNIYFYKEFPNCFPECLYHFSFPPPKYELSSCSICWLILDVITFFFILVFHIDML